MTVCAACGTDNPDIARFCLNCGTPLGPQAEVREQRKTVTVVFCDVTGSTALGEKLDPESLRRVMARYFETARGIIERHGGTVEKFIGDAVMAVFGVPVLHEDDALRAVRAASELQTSLADLNQELESSFGISLELRTGINTGEVVTGTEERLATGDAVNVAARLEHAAKPGEVLIGRETLSLVRDAVEVDAPEELELKGKVEPVSAYRLTKVRAEEPGITRHLEAPLVGRENQLRLLIDAFANVVRDETCHLFTVLGSAGVGKSRLVTEFLERVDAQTLRGRCLSYGEGISYFPVVEILKQLLGKEGEARARELLAEDDSALPALRVLLGESEAPTSTEDIALAVRRLLEGVAAETPLVVVFDDVHWGETAFLDLVEYIADLSRGVPILLLCLGRPELLDRRAGWGGGMLNATTILLEPLNREETAELIDRLAGDAGLAEVLRDRVGTTAGGNPLFLEEMVAMARESGSQEVIVPPTIRALLAARLDQLEASERVVLESGAVEGQSFHRGAIQVLAPEEQQVSAKLTKLVRKELVRPERAIWRGEEAYRFRHLLIRDAAYEALSKASRAELHQRLAGWLEERSQDLVERDEIIGYHLEQAYCYRTELGPVDHTSRALAASAGEHLKGAAKRALDRGDVVAALNLLERTGTLLPGQLDVALELSCSWALVFAGRPTEAEKQAEATLARGVEIGDRVGEMRARLRRGILLGTIDPEGRVRELEQLVEQARPVLESSSDDGSLASLYEASGWVAHMRCRFGEAGRIFEEAMEYAESAGETQFQRHLRMMAGIAITLGPIPVTQALRWLDEVARQINTFEPLLDRWRAFLFGWLGRFDEARQRSRQNTNQLLERGMTLMAAIGAQADCDIEMRAGNPVAAERVARRGCEELERMGERSWLSTLACQLAQALYSLGRDEEADAWATKGIEAGGSEDVVTQILGKQVRAKLLARRGDLEGALVLARLAIETAGTMEAPIFQGDALLDLAEVLYMAGEPEKASKRVGEALACYESKGATACVEQARQFAANHNLSIT